MCVCVCVCVLNRTYFKWYKHFLQWVQLPIGFDFADVTWNFEPEINNGKLDFMNLPITLRVGDYNLDGFPDLLAVLGNKLG